MKKLLPVVIILLFFVVAPLVHAIEMTNTTVTPSPTNMATVTGTLYRDLRNKLGSNIKQLLEQKRLANQNAFKAARDVFKQRLAALKDQRKKNVVDKVDQKLSTVNKNRTDHMGDVLDRLSGILDKISEKAALLKNQGKNTASLDTAIANARTAITTAQTAVTAQAAKEYIAQIADETTLKTTVGTTVSQLQSDLLATRKTVIDARMAVLNAAMELAKLRGEGLHPSGIPAISPTGVSVTPTTVPSPTGI